MKFDPNSFLHRAEDFRGVIPQYILSSAKMKNYFDAAEQALKGILFHYGVEGHESSHRLDKTARANEAALSDIWPRLSPLLAGFAKLYDWRNVCLYRHTDAPPESDPPISDTDLREAEHTADELLAIARDVICGS